MDYYNIYRDKFKNFVLEFLKDVWAEEVPGEELNTEDLEVLSGEISNEVYQDFFDMVVESFKATFFEDELDEAVFKKVVRAGQVIKKKVRRRPKRLNTKQKAALRKARKFAHKASAKKKRKKSLKIHSRRLGEAYINAGVSCIVTEAFELSIDGTDGKESLNIGEGYFMSFFDIDESTISLSVYDSKGDLVHEDIEVSPEFVSTCMDEGVLESLQDYGVSLDSDFVSSLSGGDPDSVISGISESDDEEEEDEEDDEEEDDEEEDGEEEEEEDEEDVEESHYSLGYDSGDGYYVIKEDKRYIMGSRVRARAYLVSEGVDIDGSCFEDAKSREITLL